LDALEIISPTFLELGSIKSTSIRPAMKNRSLRFLFKKISSIIMSKREKSTVSLNPSLDFSRQLRAYRKSASDGSASSRSLALRP
jgi:hypothetical protein